MGKKMKFEDVSPHAEMGEHKKSPRPKARPKKSPRPKARPTKSLTKRMTKKMAKGGMCRGMGAATRGGRYSKMG